MKTIGYPRLLGIVYSSFTVPSSPFSIQYQKVTGGINYAPNNYYNYIYSPSPVVTLKLLTSKNQTQQTQTMLLFLGLELSSTLRGCVTSQSQCIDSSTQSRPARYLGDLNNQRDLIDLSITSPSGGRYLLKALKIAFNNLSNKTHCSTLKAVI